MHILPNPGSDVITAQSPEPGARMATGGIVELRTFCMGPGGCL